MPKLLDENTRETLVKVERMLVEAQANIDDVGAYQQVEDALDLTDDIIKPFNPKKEA